MEYEKRLIVKMKPHLKSDIWGGTLLYEKYKKGNCYDIVAESWEISTIRNHESTVDLIHDREIPFSNYLRMIGKRTIGKNLNNFDKFPIMIKFLDAKRKLSIQVHPKRNNTIDKEIWYIVDAKPKAFVYLGLKRTLSQELVHEYLVQEKIENILRKVFVKKGDILVVPSGEVHAIGEGILICEIQDNTNVTYRLYDYNRKDDSGQKRTLNIEQGISEMILEVGNIIHIRKRKYRKIEFGNIFLAEINLCDTNSYFYSRNSCLILIVIEGQGKMLIKSLNECREEEMLFKPGEVYFLRATNGMITFYGVGIILAVEIM